MSDLLSQTANELNDLREAYKVLQSRLGEADNVIKYYADPRNYAVTIDEASQNVFQDRLTNDREPADNTPTTRVAGLRARLYARKYEFGG